MTAEIQLGLVLRNRAFAWGSRTYIMGVVNVSPDSFSGDGIADISVAVDQARRMAAEGADIIDVGGQSTRPGFEELSSAAEIDRVAPAIEAIVKAVNLPVSIDAYRATVVAAALSAGAHLVNDIWGFRKDAAVAKLAAAAGVPAVIMHNQRGREFRDVIGDVSLGLQASLAIAEAAGLPKQRLIIDPGFGFGWSVGQNIEILRRLAELRSFGLPILVGTSRKSSIGSILGVEAPEQRLWGTAATLAIAIANGADIVRVHDVAEMRQVCLIADAIVRGKA